MKPSVPLSARLALAALALLLGACAGGPVAPDWQVGAKGSMERAVAAYLEGNARVASAEFERARHELGGTGRADLVATAELLRCAGRVASLVFEACEGFERLRQDATAPQRAYADYLAGHPQSQDASLLPPAQQAAAGSDGDAATLNNIADPLSRLVAAGVMFQAGRASPAVVALAVDTASGQGWRRPLLAWLGVQARLAEQAGQVQEAARLRRRMELTQTP